MTSLECQQRIEVACPARASAFGDRFVTMLIAFVAAIGVMAASVSTLRAADNDEAGFEKVEQIKLTEKQVKGFIASQQELIALASTVKDDESAAPDPSLEGKLNALATKHGFKDFDELELVSLNIEMVMDGLDPETGKYTDIVSALKEERSMAEADKQLKGAERKKLLKEIDDAISNSEPLRHKSNIGLVQKYAKDLEKAMEE